MSPMGWKLVTPSQNLAGWKRHSQDSAKELSGPNDFDLALYDFKERLECWIASCTHPFVGNGLSMGGNNACVSNPFHSELMSLEGTRRDCVGTNDDLQASVK